MKQQRTINAPSKSGQSTLLVGSRYYERYMITNYPGGRRVALYLHYLLNDSMLEYKLSFLKPQKWKKSYQEPGQGLEKVFFYPDECDWARLSILSNATGFSRCFLFVFLMLIDKGVIRLPENITQFSFSRIYDPGKIHCIVIMDPGLKKLKRILQT
jgi:hypothetical protein